MHFLGRFLVLLVTVAMPLAAAAQSYPVKPVRLIVPFPAGGPADIFARFLAQGMGAKLGQPVVIENVGGLGGVVGVDRAAKAAPDGYTLGLNSASSVSIAPFSVAKMPYDPNKDFTLITTVVRVPEVIAVNPALPVNTLAELIAYAKANPGKINYGSAGSGSITHLAGELLKVDAGVDMVHVPYKGAAPAVTDLLSGQVQLGIFDVPVLLSHIRAGKLKALAITSARRTATLPDVQTTGEAGYPKVLSDNWYGLVGPAGLPPAILKRVRDAAISALNTAELVEQYAKVSGVSMPSSPEEYAVYLVQEQKKWGAVVKAIDFKAE
ncbi:MAG: tripartite tricarboxylate transporter substrate binding protein [Betaproteobacteria bacterium]|nr:tripartite tricarboxylate transporter substrate binding protein [Betaproteobacteria bacterium]